jgi:hypothetical protein
MVKVAELLAEANQAREIVWNFPDLLSLSFVIVQTFRL